jgi:hypothetical protein
LSALTNGCCVGSTCGVPRLVGRLNLIGAARCCIGSAQHVVDADATDTAATVVPFTGDTVACVLALRGLRAVTNTRPMRVTSCCNETAKPASGLIVNESLAVLLCVLVGAIGTAVVTSLSIPLLVFVVTVAVLLFATAAVENSLHLLVVVSMLILNVFLGALPFTVNLAALACC